MICLSELGMLLQLSPLDMSSQKCQVLYVEEKQLKTPQIKVTRYTFMGGNPVKIEFAPL